jgi:thiol-disulfide isomerase/thioredoxin
VNAATFYGQPVQVGGASGKVTLLAFYTSGQAAPAIEDLYKQYKAKGVDFLAINLDSRSGRLARTEEQVLAHYKDSGLSVPMVMDPYQLIGPKYRVINYPTLVLIGKSGTVEAVHSGVAGPVPSALPTQVDLLLQGKTWKDFPPVAATPPPPPVYPPPPVNPATATRPTATRPAAPRAPVMELIGNPAPAASVKTTDGKEIKIGSGSDHIQLLAFYASWCGFCKKAMPTVENLHKEFKDKGIEVIAINQDGREGPRGKTEEQTLATYKDWKLSMPMTMDPTQKLSAQYKVRGYPTFVLVGRNGTVEAAHVGADAAFETTARTELNLLLQGKTREAFPAPATPPPSPPPTPNAQQAQRNPAMGLSGKPAPSLAAKTVDGKDLKIGSGNGKVQLLAFYASWCGFCKRAMPAVEQLHKDYKDKGIEVIAINQDSREGRRATTEAQSLGTYKEWNLSMPVTMDPSQKIGEEFKVRGYPTFFIVGENGNVEAVYVGGGEVATGGARAKLEALLKNKAPAGG